MLFLRRIFSKRRKQLPVILLHGKIMTSDDSINLQTKRSIIDAAFSVAKGVVFLSINSPGGLPGQSQLVFDYIRMKADEKQVSVYAFIEDFGASGGYWLASAGDKIFCLETSFVGSIGVVSGGFGLQDFLKEHKIERRLMTAGEAKARDDMFSAMSEDDISYKRDLLEQMHEVFKAQILSRRPDVSELVFDARVVIGKEAVELGLVDGLSSIFAYASEHYPDYRCRFYGGKRRFGSGIMRRLISSDLGDEAMPQLRLR